MAEICCSSSSEAEKESIEVAMVGSCGPPGVPELRLRRTRPALIRQAFRLEWLTVAWMVIEGAVAIGAAVAAGSLTLAAFGLDSVVELASAGVLIWRLSVELRRGEAFSEAAERIAGRIAGALLYALAAFIVAGAAWSLWTRHGEGFSVPGLVVALLAMPIMTLLARRKIALATQLGSGAMRADAVESITCGWLSLVVVIGLVAELLTGAWWVDSVTSLGIVWFVVKEAGEARSAENCAACAVDSPTETSKAHVTVLSAVPGQHGRFKPNPGHGHAEDLHHRGLQSCIFAVRSAVLSWRQWLPRCRPSANSPQAHRARPIKR